MWGHRSRLGVGKRNTGEGVKTETQSLYCVKDHLGGVRQALDAQGQEQSRFDRDTYGQCSQTADAQSQALQPG